jgi:hypothetical protein
VRHWTQQEKPEELNRLMIDWLQRRFAAARGNGNMAAKNPLHPIPHPPKTPFLGNLLSLGTTAPIQDMMRLARELGRSSGST